MKEEMIGFMKDIGWLYFAAGYVTGILTVFIVKWTM